MAVESRVDADDNWFVGEDRVFRFVFTADGDTTGVEEWAMTLEFFKRRAAATDAPLLSYAAYGEAGPPVVAVATVDGAETTALGAGIYQFVLRRTDAGHKTVLSYGSAELRSAVTS